MIIAFTAVTVWLMDHLTLDSEKDTKLDTAVTRISIAFYIPMNICVCVCVFLNTQSALRKTCCKCKDDLTSIGGVYKYRTSRENTIPIALFLCSIHQVANCCCWWQGRKELNLTVCSLGCCWTVWSCRRERVGAPPSAQRWVSSSSAAWLPPSGSLRHSQC